jgi:hypothetical protein
VMLSSIFFDPLSSYPTGIDHAPDLLADRVLGARRVVFEQQAWHQHWFTVEAHHDHTQKDPTDHNTKSSRSGLCYRWKRATTLHVCAAGR